MPRLSSWFIKASLIYLGIGFSLGALLLANKALEFYPPLWKLLPVHSEMLLLGWFSLLAAGVAFWILPRFSSSPHPRGNEQLVWLAFWLINIGILLVSVDVVIARRGLVLAGRLAEFTGVCAFVVGSWIRVKMFGS